MIRALLAILILATGTTVFCSFRIATTTARHELADRETARQTVKQQIARLYVEKRKATELVKETKVLLAAQPSLPPRSQLAEKVLSGTDPKKFSAADSEELLAELGFNWNTTGDYLIISKASLDKISFEGMRDDKLTGAAIGTLAITPAEQADIESVTRQLSETRATWEKEHVQRTEPSGNVLAQYSLPVDKNFSHRQLNFFTNAIFNTLGAERARLLKAHSLNWMQAMGLFTGPDLSGVPAELVNSLPASALNPKPTTLTLERVPSGNTWNINCTLEQGGNTMTTGVTPWQPFPEAFRGIFPGGWRELAAREGFELPKAFKQKRSGTTQ